MDAVLRTAASAGVAPTCEALGVPRASLYRHVGVKGQPPEPKPRLVPARAMSAQETAHVLAVLRSERFVDLAPAEVCATLLDEGVYLCSSRTMYRILDANAEVRERRNQLTHPKYTKHELLATGPNQVWSWDITKLLGPVKWSYFQLYVIIDIFSRYVVGWMIAPRESASLARRLIMETCAKQGIKRRQLTIHADRGSSMTSKPVAFLMADLGITKTHSRPHVSNDNPYSESQFKTMKYRPAFPARFGCLEDARAFSLEFFAWYNNDHHHSGINMLTPATVHYERSPQVLEAREAVLAAAYARHPDRFVRKPPTAGLAPKAVWINKPMKPSSSSPDEQA